MPFSENDEPNSFTMTESDAPTPRRPAAVARAAGLFVLISAVCGLLIAGAVMPSVGAAWFTARTTEQGLEELPVAFDTPAQSQRSTVLDANGDVLAYFFEENRVYVELDEIAPIMRQAMVAIEDHRFYEHGPLDAQGTFRAFLANLAAGGVTQGGSTITQQYVKMVQIEEAKKRGDEAAIKAAQDGTYQRKIRELRYAISVEKALSKDEILERYLNIAYFGDGAYGIEVAAQHYFSTSANELTLGQAAMLAGLVQNPTAYNPVDQPTAALNRRDVVLNRMTELGIITAAKAAKAKRADFDDSDVTNTPNGCQSTDYPFVCDYVYRTLAQTPSLGANDAERTEHRQTWRPDRHHRVRSRHAGHDPGGGEQRRRPDRPGDRGHGHDRTGHRADRRHGPEPAGDGLQGRQGPDVLELLGAAEHGRRAGLPGRLDLQGLHRGRSARAGHPAVSALRRPRHDGLLGREIRHLLRAAAGLWQLAGQQLHRHQRRDGHAPGHRALGQHLLRSARPGRRHVRRGEDGGEARR